MARLPTRDDLGPLPSARTGRPIATYQPQVPDLSLASKAGVEVARGLQNLGAGFAQAAANIQKAQEEADTLDAIKAKAHRDIKYMELERSFDNDPNPETWDERFTKRAKEIDAETFSMIRNPEARERLAPQFQVDQAQSADRLLSKKMERDKGQQLIDLDGALDAQRQIYLNPQSTPEQRAQARANMASAIEASRRVGVITPEGEISLNDKYTKGVVKKAAELELARDPETFGKKVSFAPKAPVIMQRLMDDFGITKEQAAGVLGNLGHETGGFVHFQEIAPLRGRGGIGWAQWTGPRRDDFLEWAAANNLDPRSDEANYGFLAHELSGNYASSLEEVRKSETAQDAMLAFERTYERSGIKAYGSRLQYAQEALAAYDGSSEFADLDPMDRADLEEKARKALEERLKVGHSYEASVQLLNPYKVWDSNDSDDKKRMDVLTEGVAEPLMNGDQATFDEKIMPLVTQTRMIPRNVRGTFEAMLRSPDPKTVLFAFENMDKLERSNPQTFARDMSADTIKNLTRYREKLIYHKPEEIVEELQRSEDPARAKARESMTAEGVKKAQKLSPYVAGYFNESWLPYINEPELPAEGLEAGTLKQEFEQLFSEAYAETGNDSAAEKQAVALLKKRWGVSHVSGSPRLMRMPPEQFNPAGLPPDWMEDQARDRLEPLIGQQPFALRGDDRTELEIQNGKLPTYPVLVEGDGGKWSELADPDGDGSVRIFFDPKIGGIDKWVPPQSAGFGFEDDAAEIAQDVFASVPHYARTTVSSVLGLPGDIVKGGRWLASKVGLPTPETPVVGSDEIEKAVEKITGPLHKPETKTGKMVDLAAALLPGVFGGPGGIAAKMATRVAAPATASSTLGALTEGTDLQPWAEVAGLLVAPIAINKGVEPLLNTLQRNKLVIDTQDLKALRDAHYKLADTASTSVKQDVYSIWATKTLADFRWQNQDIWKTNPPVASILRLMGDAVVQGGPVTLRQLQFWRKMAGRIMQNPQNDTMGQGALLYAKLSTLMRGMSPQHLSGPNSTVAIEALRAGDELHGRYKNSQVLDTIYKRAKNRLANYSQAGEATGLRQKFRQLADKFADPNSKEYRFFTPEMREAIEEVARGTPTIRALRAIGSFVPWGLKGAASYGSPVVVAALLGFHGFVSSVAPIAAGITTGAKMAEHLLTKAAANRAADLVRMGRPLPKPPTPAYPELLPPLGAQQLLDQENSPTSR